MQRKRAADIRNRGRYIKPPGTSGLSAFEKVWNMTGTTRSSEGLNERRKRLLYRCWHRGTREMDLILGRFADAHIGDLSDAELEELERLGELPDPDLYAALSGAGEIAPEFAHGIFLRIKSFRAPSESA
jgi:antitoxin CptB